MGSNTKIEWCDHTANLWHGCTKVHAGCDHCYAETQTKRWNRDLWGNDKPRMQIASVWKNLKLWQAAAEAAGRIDKVFVGSMMDIFEKPFTLVDSKGEMVTDGIHHYPANTGQLRDQLFEDVIPHSPNLLFLLLTKRPSNIKNFIPDKWKANPPDNVMFGTSVSDQKTAETLIPKLLEVNGKHFLSIEPLLGPIDIPLDWLTAGIYICPECGSTDCTAVGSDGEYEGMECRECDGFCERRGGIDWVIVGGESGHDARPMHPDWVRSIRNQCKEWMVPFFFKQWGEWRPPLEDEKYDTGQIKRGLPRALLVAKDGTLHRFVDTAGDNPHVMLNVEKKKAGRLLDGQEYNEVPKFFHMKNSTV